MSSRLREKESLTMPYLSAICGNITIVTTEIVIRSQTILIVMGIIKSNES